VEEALGGGQEGEALGREPLGDLALHVGDRVPGVDLDGADTVIDCWLQGDWRATRSGS
jgi:hypothetical protein